jgi:hypothetical protein
VNAQKELAESYKQPGRYNKNPVHSKAMISTAFFLPQISLQTIMKK